MHKNGNKCSNTWLHKRIVPLAACTWWVWLQKSSCLLILKYISQNLCTTATFNCICMAQDSVKISIPKVKNTVSKNLLIFGEQYPLFASGWNAIWLHSEHVVSLQRASLSQNRGCHIAQVSSLPKIAIANPSIKCHISKVLAYPSVCHMYEHMPITLVQSSTKGCDIVNDG